MAHPPNLDALSSEEFIKLNVEHADRLVGSGVCRTVPGATDRMLTLIRSASREFDPAAKALAIRTLKKAGTCKHSGIIPETVKLCESPGRGFTRQIKTHASKAH